jgi:hypothetical protein
MNDLFNRLNDAKRKDIRILAGFIDIFCKHKHGDTSRVPFQTKDASLQAELGDLSLCHDCSRLLEHGMA